MGKKVISLFSGAGGLDLGFKSADFKLIWSNELDKYAGETYKANFGNHITIGDIRNINKKNIPIGDVLIGGFPCQPFSVAGHRKGFEDQRGELFWQIVKVANNSKIQIVVLENVKNLLTHDNGNTIKTILFAFKKYGFYTKYKILKSSDFNIPQTRQRLFILCFKNKKQYENHEWPVIQKQYKLPKTFKDMLEPNVTNKKYFYNNSKYNKLLTMEGTDSVLQIRRRYVRKNKSKKFPTLTANMGGGGHNVPIIFDDSKKLFRKLTPRETFNVQGFPRSFIFPVGMSDTQLYKQAGNAVTVTVAKAIATSIMRVIND